MRPLVIASLCDDLVGDYLKGVVNVLGHFFHALSNFEALGDPLGVPGPSHGDEIPAALGEGDCSPAPSPKASESTQ